MWNKVQEKIKGALVRWCVLALTTIGEFALMLAVVLVTVFATTFGTAEMLSLVPWLK
jgi:hypothetical protein